MPEAATGAGAYTLEAFTRDYEVDPHAATRRARRQFGWWMPNEFAVSVMSYEAVDDLLRDQRLLSYGTLVLEVQGITDGPLYDWWRRAPLHVDGQAHTRMRKPIVRTFTPKRVQALQPDIERFTAELIDGIDEETEFMAAVADQLPVLVMAELLGIPRDDLDRFTTWSRDLGLAFGGDVVSHLDQVNAAAAGLMDYADTLIADRRVSPGDDLVSHLVAIESESDDLDESELQALIVALIFAGHDTTRNQLGCALHTFAHHPDQWTRLRAEPELVPSAVEEVLRFEPAVTGTARVARQAFTHDGLDVGEGSLVALSALAANRDPDVFDRPDTFDVSRYRERDAARPPFTFGGGVHHCVGAWLARAEIASVLGALTRAFESVEPAGDPTWRASSGIRGPVTLPLRFAV